MRAKISLTSGLIAVLLLPASCFAQSPDSTITPEMLLPHLTYLASPDREGRDDWGKIESRDYIINHFKSHELKPLFGESYLQVVPQFGSEDEKPPIVGQNIGAFVAGTDPELKDEWIIVNAHYDHLGIRNGKVYPGADDNASGVSMLLEVAAQVAKSPCRRSVAFLSFDLEEYLLWGSRWFLAHSPMDVENIKFCLTADMIGRSLGGIDSPIVFVLGSERSLQVREEIKKVKVPEDLELARLGVDIIGVRSDYGPFYYRRIPFLFFSTGEHPDYHTPQDTLERLDITKAARVSTVMSQVAFRMANTEEEIIWNGEVSPDLEEVRAVNRVATHFLKADAANQFEMTDLQRFFLTQVKSKTNYMIRNNQVSDNERKWLVRATQIMMLTLF
ncbi:M28 family peptidase [Planctomicrobium sp.]|jgi:hypothetical protein|nr:M28 family peptidase [Planctomicrobium sp.]MDB4731319.1 M28 family peptidase [bacterium]MDB4743664.1 M28 family peptidase [Planctomicrobium sp.]